MKNNTRTRTLISLILAISLLALPITAFAKKGDKNFKRGMELRGAAAMGQGGAGIYARRGCRPVKHGVPAPFSPREFQRLADVHAARQVALGEGGLCRRLQRLPPGVRLRSGKRAGCVGDGAHVAHAGREGRPRSS